MRTRSLRLLLALSACGLLFSCGGGSEANGAPGLAVQQFYESLNAGDYAAAKRLYNAETLQVLDDPDLTSDAAFREWAETVTRKGSVSRVRILDSNTDADGGTVSYEVVFRDGSTYPSEVAVTQEDGRWKLGLIQ